MDKIASGMTVLIGGFAGKGSPNSLIKRLMGMDVSGLTVIANDAGPEGSPIGKLLTSGKVKRLIVSHVGLNKTVGQYAMDKKIDMDVVPQGMLVERIRCAGFGLGGVLYPVNGRFIKAYPLPGDIALVYADAADRHKNLIFKSVEQNFNKVMAMAGEYTYAEAGYIFESINPERVMLPGVFVHEVSNSEKGCL